MNILLRSFPETSPKIAAFRKQIKTLKTKDPVCFLPPSLTPVPLLFKCVSLLSFSKALRIPVRLATKTAMGCGRSFQANSLNISPKTLPFPL